MSQQIKSNLVQTDGLSKEQKRQFGAEQFQELCERGFSQKRAGKIIRITGAGLAVYCVDWTNSIFEQLSDCNGEPKVERPNDNNLMVEAFKSFTQQGISIEGLGKEEVDREIAAFIIDLAATILIELLAKEEPLLSPLKYRNVEICFSVDKRETIKILTGAIEVSSYLPQIRARQRQRNRQ